MPVNRWRVRHGLSAVTLGLVLALASVGYSKGGNGLGSATGGRGTGHSTVAAHVPGKSTTHAKTGSKLHHPKQQPKRAKLAPINGGWH